jgi:hypothetical protein
VIRSYCARREASRLFFAQFRLFGKYQTNFAEGTVSRNESRVDLKVRNNLVRSEIERKGER